VCVCVCASQIDNIEDHKDFPIASSDTTQSGASTGESPTDRVQLKKLARRVSNIEANIEENSAQLQMFQSRIGAKANVQDCERNANEIAGLKATAGNSLGNGAVPEDVAEIIESLGQRVNKSENDITTVYMLLESEQRGAAGQVDTDKLADKEWCRAEFASIRNCIANNTEHTMGHVNKELKLFERDLRDYMQSIGSSMPGAGAASPRSNGAIGRQHFRCLTCDNVMQTLDGPSTDAHRAAACASPINHKHRDKDIQVGKFVVEQGDEVPVFGANGAVYKGRTAPKLYVPVDMLRKAKEQNKQLNATVPAAFMRRPGSAPSRKAFSPARVSSPTGKAHRPPSGRTRVRGKESHGGGGHAAHPQAATHARPERIRSATSRR
jgi:hypothetical protein